MAPDQHGSGGRRPVRGVRIGCPTSMFPHNHGPKDGGGGVRQKVGVITVVWVLSGVVRSVVGLVNVIMSSVPS